MSSSMHPGSPSPAAGALMPRRSNKASILSDIFVFAGGAAFTVLIFCGLYPSSFSVFVNAPMPASISRYHVSDRPFDGSGGVYNDPPAATYYDDPSVSYSIGSRIGDWDAKRREWLRLHPAYAADGRERLLMLSGSQPGPCRNPVGDHLLLRLFKNKVDYCRRHGIEIFYSNAVLHPDMNSFWTKIPIIRAAMLAHPEAEWVWWVDSDAVFTDMDFELPLDRYRPYNLVANGWPHLVYDARSWVSLNAGVFIIRNCQWSLDFMAAWAAMGPASPDYERWGKILKAELSDKEDDAADDQSALVYLLLKHKDRWGDKIYLENEYTFQGYWIGIVGRLENITTKYTEMERRVHGLRRRHAEILNRDYGRLREEQVTREEALRGGEGWRRPFITHFTGCQPCSGDHNKLYSGNSCWEGMQRALHFADDQVLRDYGFRHDGLLNIDVKPLPFDYPATE
ncbi:hypothetical protein Cni_G01994 [Canna indica]|uniref:Uncharacterized protein n=1 Tax=Canna indica TaxID=4628 RepID=A0AAQ3JP69_9LILI|nr:hypothetical protein Cni_G01994 [Canna indica]